MTIHSSLVAAWPADLVTGLAAGGITITTANVYFGRRRQFIARQDYDVWVERLRVEKPGAAGSGLQLLARHPYRVHLRRRTNAGDDKTGNTQLTTVEAGLQALVDRYQGSRRLSASSGLSNVVSLSAEEESIDLDPTDENLMDGVVLVTWFVKE